MNRYKSYHTSVKTCFSLGIEKQLLPEDFLNLIPPSTSHSWKNQHPSKDLGDELAFKIENSFKDVHTLLDQRAVRLRRALVSFIRLYLSILQFIGENQFRTILKQNKEKIVSLIDNASGHFGNRYGVCKLLRISPVSYRNWKRIATHGCKESLLGVCFKSFPQQISRKEITLLRKYMSNSRYLHWSAAAIWAKAMRNTDISMSLASWYRYARALGITKTRALKKVPKTRKSVRASSVNEIWHMDVSHFKTEDNIKFYIYTVVDNLSRRIIKYEVSTILSAKVRLNSLKEAIHSEFDVDLNRTPSLDLIVDVLYTPNEIAQKPTLLEVKPKLQKINQERLDSNRAYCCKSE